MILAFFIFAFALKAKISHLLIAALFGLIAVLPISFIQFFVQEISPLRNLSLFLTLLQSLILYGLVEELVKTALILPLPHKNYTTFNFLILSFMMGITIGCFESAVYLFEYALKASDRGAELLYGHIFLRIFTSDLIHLTCTGLCGLFIYSCRQKKTKISILITAILIHGFYDFFAGFQNGLRFFAIIAILLAILECRIKYTTLQTTEDDSL